jgi:nicotinate phosphoribosyltransferase
MLTDLYQLTMAQGYWKLGKHLQRASFDLFFREHPFQGGYTVFCGLQAVLEMVQSFKFTQQDIAYLASLKGAKEVPLFSEEFLQALLELQLSLDIDAVREGNIVFPKEPLLRVEGPLWECQLLETGLLNLINFPTLIATKAARICYAAKGDPIIEFGLRRAQGPDGGLTASRAAYVGGAVSTSNVLAGQRYGIPVAGTHAHSWVMAFSDEMTSFRSYAEVMPHNCILLVDTYNSLDGIRNAIQIGLDLKRKGYALLGIRLDSGDLAALSIAARKLLDEAGLLETQIVGSNDLDEYTITKLKNAGAKISIWGVGTHLATAYEQPALGGVYKLVAIQDNKGEWLRKEKQTDDIRKKSRAGIHKIRRFYLENKMQRDVIYDQIKGECPEAKTNETFEELLIPVVRLGKPIIETPLLSSIQRYAHEQLQKLPDELKILKPKNQYSVTYQES